jgi:phytoene dehydrogenase-like protein
VVGRQYLLDPARVPAGAAALWLQLQEVPYAPRGDAAGELDTTHGWTEALAKGYPGFLTIRRNKTAFRDVNLCVLKALRLMEGAVLL